MEVNLDRKARQDLADIWDFLAVSSERIANDCIDRITERCHPLADFPKMGIDRSDISPGARMLVVERWLVFYRVSFDEVRIVRIVDSTRDLSKLNLPDE